MSGTEEMLEMMGLQSDKMAWKGRPWSGIISYPLFVHAVWENITGLIFVSYEAGLGASCDMNLNQ